MNRRCREYFRICISNSQRHRSPRRKSRYVHSPGVNTVVGLHTLGDLRDECGLTLIAPLVRSIEPVPALEPVGLHRLLGIDNDHSFLFSKGVELSPSRHIFRVLRTTVQDDDQRCRPRFIVLRRQVHLEPPRPTGSLYFTPGELAFGDGFCNNGCCRGRNFTHHWSTISMVASPSTTVSAF